MFIPVSKRFIATEEPSLNAEFGLTWMKLSLCRLKPLYVGCLYRKAIIDIEPLLELEMSLRSSPKSNYSLQNVLLTGDFNTPDIDWGNMEVK